MKTRFAAMFLAGVGALWLLLNAVMFVSSHGVIEPVSSAGVILWWTDLCVGPLLLITGATFLFTRRAPSRLATLLAGGGCLILTFLVLRVTVAGAHRKPLQSPTPSTGYAVMLLITLGADAAVWETWRS